MPCPLQKVSLPVPMPTPKAPSSWMIATRRSLGVLAQARFRDRIEEVAGRLAELIGMRAAAPV